VTGSLLTASEVAKLLGVPVSWVYEQSRQGRIPTVTLGRYRRYRLDSIEAWVSELETTGQRGRLGSAWRERPTPPPRRHAHR
jgi:excisionase family DNA binding protein